MEPEIRELSEKKLVGKHLRMSMTVNRTGELWKSFMSRHREIAYVAAPELYSMQVYDADYNHTTYNPDAAFEKWAAVEVTQFDTIPEDMDTSTLAAGTYAVFHYRGAASEGAKIFGYIFGTWLPQSDYALDHRPHFELLGTKYNNNNSADSEEEIWIPVKKRI